MRNLDLPLGWIFASLGQISSKINPGFPFGKWKRDDSEGVPHLRPMNISPDGEIDFTNLKYAFKEGYDALKKGDILFNNTNSPKWIGKTTYIKKDTNWAYSNHMTRIRFNHEYINPAYVSYYLHHLLYKGYYLMNCKHHVNQASVNTSFLKNIPIPVPPTAEQVRIVGRVEELISRLDAGVRSLQAAQTQLEKYRQTTLKQAYTGKLTEKWRNNENEKYMSIANTYKIPYNWQYVEIKYISEKITDGEHLKPKYVENGIPFLTAKNVRETGVNFTNINYVSEEDAKKSRKRCNPKKGDILIVSRGATIGRGCVINTERIFTLLGSVILIKLMANTFPKYINYILKSSEMKKNMINLSSSTAQQAIYLRDIKNLQIPLPPLNEQIKISNILDHKISIMENIKTSVSNIINLNKSVKQSVLKKAFEGRLVPQDLNDEPASLLLERIKAQKVKQRKLT